MNEAVKEDSGKRKLSLIHPAMMNLLLPDKDGYELIRQAVMHLSHAAHAKDENAFLISIEDALEEIEMIIGSREWMVELTAVAMEYGANKPEYGRNNWKKGMEWSRLLDAALRHGLAILKGEEVDQDSGNSHLCHMLGSIHMLIGNRAMGVGTNDIY